MSSSTNSTPETVVQMHLGLDPVELSTEVKQIEANGYAFGKANFCNKDVHYAGDINILTNRGFVAIGLSEGAKQDAINVACRAAASIAEHNEAYLIMGGTRTGDMAVIREHIASGGKVLVVLPVGLKEYGKRFITDEVKQFLSNGTLTLISQFSPARAWDLQAAKLRNDLIAKASWTLFVADCGGNKGIWGLAECFKAASKTIRINRLTKESRMEMYGLKGKLGARELKAEPVEISDGESDIYAILTHR